MKFLGAILSKRNSRQILYQIRSFYDVRTKNDTIFAPATHVQKGIRAAPLGIIRVSGPQVSSVISKLTNLDTIEDTSETIHPKHIQPRKSYLTRIYSLNCPREVIDVGLVLWFPKPKSYTGEDVCEFHVHGALPIMRSLLENLGRLDGLRPAEKGEFTRRAVMNGKLNPVQAESIGDLISSQTDKQRALALKGLEGSVVKQYESWRADLIRILAHLEASIDFGEDELIGEEKVVRECIEQINDLSNRLREFINLNSRSMRFVNEGFKLAIMGKPNVGKSSLMNSLCLRDKSIVSPISGTTRDVIEQNFELGGYSLTLCDTCGIRDISSTGNDQDRIELEGIKRAHRAGSQADVIIYVIEPNDLSTTSRPSSTITSDIKSLLSSLDIGTEFANNCDKKSLNVVLNKIDLIEDDRLEIANSFEQFTENLKIELRKYPLVISGHTISCQTNKNMLQFIDSLINQLNSMSNNESDKNGTTSHRMDYVNERHLSLLTSCQKHLHVAGQLKLATIDRMAQHVREAIDYLGRCTGIISQDEVLDVIFRDFCIGK